MPAWTAHLPLLRCKMALVLLAGSALPAATAARTDAVARQVEAAT